MKNLTGRQHIIILVVFSTIFLGIYGYYRYMPEQQVINRLAKTLNKNIKQVKSPQFPEEPVETVGEVKEDAEALEQTLVNLRLDAARTAESLAPINNQDVLLKISEAARTANVKVIESVPYLVQRRGEAKIVAAPKIKKRLRKKLRKQRMINARKRTGITSTVKQLGTLGEMPKEGELIDRVINDLDEARPLQRLSIEGSFSGLQQFIQALQIMPWQITVAKIDIDVSVQTPPPGVPQPVVVRLILAM